MVIKKKTEILSEFSARHEAGHSSAYNSWDGKEDITTTSARVQAWVGKYVKDSSIEQVHLWQHSFTAQIVYNDLHRNVENRPL